MKEFNFVNNVNDNNQLNYIFKEDDITKIVDLCNRELRKLDIKIDRLKEIYFPNIPNGKHIRLKNGCIVTKQTYYDMVNYLLKEDYTLQKIDFALLNK